MILAFIGLIVVVALGATGAYFIVSKLTEKKVLKEEAKRQTSIKNFEKKLKKEEDKEKEIEKML